MCMVFGLVCCKADQRIAAAPYSFVPHCKVRHTRHPAAPYLLSSNSTTSQTLQHLPSSGVAQPSILPPFAGEPQPCWARGGSQLAEGRPSPCCIACVARRTVGAGWASSGSKSPCVRMFIEGSFGSTRYCNGLMATRPAQQEKHKGAPQPVRQHGARVMHARPPIPCGTWSGKTQDTAN